MQKSFFPNPEGLKRGYFLSQPHQPFFLFGIVWAVIEMVLFALAYKGILFFAVSLQEFHVYSLIFIVFSHFFIGFIFTTFPRFCQSAVIPTERYLRIFYLLQGGTVLFSIGAVMGVPLYFVGKTILFIVMMMVVWVLHSIYKTGTMSRSGSDPFWILVAFYAGAAANLLFLIETLVDFDVPFAVKAAFNLYLVFLIFTIAQRMVPFFSHLMPTKKEYFMPAVFWLLTAKTVMEVSAFSWGEIGIDIVLASVILWEFLRWKLPLFNSPAILWVLHLALFWLPTGLILGAVVETAALLGGEETIFFQKHLLAIGFATTMLIGFGTRVTLGHSGQPPHADRTAVRIFWFIQIVLLLRTWFSLQYVASWGMPWVFDLSFTAWVVLFILWAWRYAPVLYRGKKLSPS